MAATVAAQAFNCLRTHRRYRRAISGEVPLAVAHMTAAVAFALALSFGETIEVGAWGLWLLVAHAAQPVRCVGHMLKLAAI